MSATLQDNILIKNYLDGDEKSLEILIQKYLRPIYSFTYRNVGNENDAEDITQETFLKVWRNIRKFDQNKNFKPWLFQIAKNTSIDFLRKRKTIPFSRFENGKGQNVLIETFEAKVPNLIEILSNKKVLAAAMQGLDKNEQRIINLRHEYGMSFKEIAEVFSESINTIKSRYRRTIASLRKNIKES